MNLFAFSSLMLYLSSRLFVALTLYAFLGTFILLHYFYEKITTLSMSTTQKMTSVQYQVVRIYENRESIAFYNGAARECRILWNFFDAFVKAAYERMVWAIGMHSFTEVLEDVTVVFHYLVIAPLYFGGEIEYGVVSQSAMAFHRVRSALNIIVDNFSVISSIRATTLRLKNLLEDLEEHERRHSFVLSSALCSERKYALQVKNLTLCTPVPASTLLCKSLSFQVPLGTNLLVSGSTGCGKSSLLRCFANLWKPKEGSVLFGCNTKHVAFVPQTPYMPIGTLREAVLYPNGEDADKSGRSSDKTLLHVLELACLPHLVERVGGLDASRNWNQILSQGEQQRIAFARLFLQKPSSFLR